MTKSDMRRMLRKRAVSAEARAAESLAACRHILASPEYKGAYTAGGYLPMAREMDITPVLADVLRQGKRLALPRCEENGQMTLRTIQNLAELVPGPFGLMEPAQSAPILPPDEVELLLVPLEGVDKRGMRLGKGGGYYDRLLAHHPVPTMGCALSHQWVDALPCDPWDMPLHACVDATGVHRFQD